VEDAKGIEMTNSGKKVVMFAALFLNGCAGCERGCSDFGADALGANWVVVQYDYQMRPANCWQVKGQSISNEGSSDGIYWVSNSGNLIHLSGWYNRVQVEGSWETAANELGIDLSRCVGGQYKSVHGDPGLPEE
jgi:hypothetical protein